MYLGFQEKNDFVRSQKWPCTTYTWTLEVIQAPRVGAGENLVLLLKYLGLGKLITTTRCDKFPRGTIISHPAQTSFGSPELKVFRGTGLHGSRRGRWLTPHSQRSVRQTWSPVLLLLCPLSPGDLGQSLNPSEAYCGCMQNVPETNAFPGLVVWHEKCISDI